MGKYSIKQSHEYTSFTLINPFEWSDAKSRGDEMIMREKFVGGGDENEWRQRKCCIWYKVISAEKWIGHTASQLWIFIVLL